MTLGIHVCKKNKTVCAKQIYSLICLLIVQVFVMEEPHLFQPSFGVILFVHVTGVVSTTTDVAVVAVYK